MQHSLHKLNVALWKDSTKILALTPFKVWCSDILLQQRQLRARVTWLCVNDQKSNDFRSFELGPCSVYN